MVKVESHLEYGLTIFNMCSVNWDRVTYHTWLALLSYNWNIAMRLLHTIWSTQWTYHYQEPASAVLCGQYDIQVHELQNMIWSTQCTYHYQEPASAVLCGQYDIQVHELQNMIWSTQCTYHYQEPASAGQCCQQDSHVGHKVTKYQITQKHAWPPGSFPSSVSLIPRPEKNCVGVAWEWDYPFFHELQLTSICCTLRSRKLASFRTDMRLLGPTHPMEVPRPPFSFSTTSLSRRDFATLSPTGAMEE